MNLELQKDQALAMLAFHRKHMNEAQEHYDGLVDDTDRDIVGGVDGVHVGIAPDEKEGDTSRRDDLRAKAAGD